MEALWFDRIAFAWLTAIGLRATGAVAREVASTPFRVAGWLLCGLAAAFAAAPSGAWVPLWLVLLLTAAGALVDRMIHHRTVRPAADTVYMVVILLASWSPVDPGHAVVSVVLYVLFGRAADLVARRLPRWLAVVGAVVPVLLLIPGIIVDSSDLLPRVWSVDRTFPLHLGVALPDAGVPVEVDGGDTAWILHPGGEPRGAVLLLHGADPAGSHQGAAYVLQRALVDAGYIVLSLDHPGYGRSPYPDEGQPVSEWDPLPAERAAYELLRRGLPDEKPKLIVGHSMGTAGVLRLMKDGASPTLAAMFGGSIPDSTKRQDYWYRRFHWDRGMTRRLPREKWKDIRRGYYSVLALTDEMTAEHPPLLLARFGVEWPNIQQERTALWEAIPDPKSHVSLEATSHYFNAFYIQPRFIRQWLNGRLVIGDVRGVSRVQRILSLHPLPHESSNDRNAPPAHD